MENEYNSLLENDLYSTEYRFFDPRLGRWMSLDPLMDQFPWMSPFVGMDNNPISMTDPLGLSTEVKRELKIFKSKGDLPEVYATAKKPSLMRIRMNKFKNSLISFGKSNWREKYFGGLLSFRDKASGWASEQSSKMSEAVHQVDEIMKPYKDEKVAVMKDLYTIQATIGGSGATNYGVFSKIEVSSKVAELGLNYISESTSSGSLNPLNHNSLSYPLTLVTAKTPSIMRKMAIGASSGVIEHSFNGGFKGAWNQNIGITILKVINGGTTSIMGPVYGTMRQGVGGYGINALEKQQKK